MTTVWQFQKLVGTALVVVLVAIACGLRAIAYPRWLPYNCGLLEDLLVTMLLCYCIASSEVHGCHNHAWGKVLKFSAPQSFGRLVVPIQSETLLIQSHVKVVFCACGINKVLKDWEPRNLKQSGDKVHTRSSSSFH